MHSDDLRTQLRRQLSVAVRENKRPAVSALRSALAALDNAEAIPPGEDPQPEVSQYVAGGVGGVGAAEVQRRVLDVESQRAIVRAEIESSRTAATTYEQLGQSTRAADLRLGADVLAAVLNSTT